MQPEAKLTILRELLTKKELEVTKLVAEGHSNPDIAAELGIKYGTVVSHIRSAFLKLRCKNRVQLAAKYLLEGQPNA